MPLEIPKQDATQEEINAWIVEIQEKYDTMENDLSNANTRIQNLLNENNRLTVKITGKKEDKEEEEEETEIPFCIDKETYEKLSEREVEELKEIIEGDE